MVERFNSTTSIIDAYYALAGTVFVESIRAAGSVDGPSVMQKIVSFPCVSVCKSVYCRKIMPPHALWVRVCNKVLSLDPSIKIEARASANN